MLGFVPKLTQFVILDKTQMSIFAASIIIIYILILNVNSWIGTLGSYGGQATLNRWVFSLRRNVVIFPTYLKLTGSEFHRVGAATEKALASTFFLTQGIKSRLELYDRSCLGCLAGVNSECKYAVCLDKSV